ncbi:non-ribosomal peptide synthetase [Chloroflexi bacterium TSY]|nr:non-ribosomal peptide synthetase [Chloroflexi bacterium TSY]
MDNPKILCIHQLFETQTEQTPDANAIIFEDEQLTYQELNQLSNQLANYLRALGVGPEDLVGLMLGRSAQMIIGIMGILKAGAAYVPMDPHYPKDRLAFMLQDTQCNVLLTEESLKENLLAIEETVAPAVRMVCIDTDWPLIAELGMHNLTTMTVADNLAVVMYTSGSTGVPKGVMLTHANLFHFVQAVRLTLGISKHDVYLHSGSITYALSIRQLMVPLCHGTTLVMASSTQLVEPLCLFELIKQKGVTRMDFVPSFWRSCNQALDELAPAERAELLDNQLQHIVCVGEPLLSDIPRKWTVDFRHNAQLTNIFGQTETTGLVAAYPIPTSSMSDNAEEQQINVVPVGRPTANTKLYILDDAMQPVPAGVPGDLYISNPSIARGYLNHPQLTAEKFIRNPFSDRASINVTPLPDSDGSGIEEKVHARFYRTGDIARLLSNGNLELMGRRDHQVKLRGMRIEPGEIEGAILSHEAVTQCTVTTDAEEPHEHKLKISSATNSSTESRKRLIAYYVAHNTLLPAGLRAFLQEKLPAHMIPTVLVRIETMPLTPNGKIDRLALPPPLSVGDSTTYTPPRNSTEQLICKILEELLQVQQVGVHDYFLDLGLHSLHLAQIQSKLTELLSKEIHMIDLLNHSTISSLAKYLSQVSDDQTSEQRERSISRADKRKAKRRQRQQRHIAQKRRSAV